MSAVTHERPWWTRAPNPPCRRWCQDEHRPGEFADGGGMSCRKTFDQDDWFGVDVMQSSIVDIDENPDSIELTEIGIYAWEQNSEPTVDEVERYARAMLAAVEFVRAQSAGPTREPNESGIVCPEWCVVPAKTHVADLQDFEGRVIHHSREISNWSLTSVTRPDGQWWPGDVLGEGAPVQVMRDEDHTGEFTELEAEAATRQAEASGLGELVKWAGA